jgi:hypothetical protein
MFQQESEQVKVDFGGLTPQSRSGRALAFALGAAALAVGAVFFVLLLPVVVAGAGILAWRLRRLAGKNSVVMRETIEGEFSVVESEARGKSAAR